jgi:RNaseH domain of pPIWI_RE
LLAKGKGDEKILKLSPEAQAQFAAHVFTDTYSEPTLVLLEAQDWRNHDVLPQFANGKVAEKDQLNLTHVKTFEHLYTRTDLPNLRVIRVRTMGSGETPQYFAVREDEEGEWKEEKDFKRLTGFVDTQATSEFFHYLSIGGLPTTAAKEQQNKLGLYKTDEGGGIAFKHQTIVELVPFFLQENDNPQAWCHIPHFMRVSPGWDGGNIVFPYPMHLAKCMIEDQLCILEGGLSEEEA